MGWQLSAETANKASKIAGTHGELLVLFSASIVTMVAASIQCYNSSDTSSPRHFCLAADKTVESYQVWAVVCPAVSLLVSILLLIPRLAGVLTKQVDFSMQFLAPCLLGLWMGGTGCMTFHFPFAAPGNGFYGAWACLISAALLTERYCLVFRRLMERTGVATSMDVSGLWFASIILVIQAAVDQQAYHTVPYSSFWIWAIVVSTATMLLCLALQLDVMNKQFVSIISLLLLAGWTAAAGALTFQHPYVAPGNAYFAIWMGFVASVRFFRVSFFQMFELPQVSIAKQIEVELEAAVVAEVQVVDYQSPEYLEELRMRMKAVEPAEPTPITLEM